MLLEWRRTIHTAASSLEPGGWFLICAEPNLAHTFISCRVGKLTQTHEIGISRKQLTHELRRDGFRHIRSFSSPLHYWTRLRRAASGCNKENLTKIVIGHTPVGVKQQFDLSGRAA